jgi:protein-tyrosine phosphatase
MQPSVYPIPLDVPGRLWIMPRPKMEWLAEEIAAYHLLGMDKVVSLLTADEADALGLSEEGAMCAARGITFVNYPIPDRCVAVDAGTFAALANDLLGDLKAGRGVGIHCRAGIGRAGTLACSVLAYYGMTVGDAIAHVGKSRGVPVPDTDAQAAFIHRLVAAAGANAKGTSAAC